MTGAEGPIQRMWDFVYAYDAAYDRAAREVGLSAAQACLLRAVSQEPRTMGELAAELLCDASNVTQLAARLESAGLVERSTDTRDRRAKRVTITDSGRAADVRVRECFAYPRERVEGLTPDEQAQLSRLLGRLLEAPHDPTEQERS